MSNSNEYWVVIYNDKKSCSASKEDEKSANRFIKELQEEWPGNFNDAYAVKVSEVLDDE